MFASRITKTVQLPSEPSVSVTIRKLGWLQRQAAQQASQQKSARGLVAMGGSAFMREWKSMQSDKPQETAEAVADPINSHDQLSVLVSGILSWTADVPVSREAIEDLGPDDAEFLAREILTLTIPPARTEEQEKNAGSPSTAI